MKGARAVPGESSVAFPGGCRNCLTGSAWIYSAESSAGSCARPLLTGPPAPETPRRPAPSTGSPWWRWRAGWSSAWLHLHSVRTQPASSLGRPQPWRGLDPSCCSWNINHKKRIQLNWLRPHCSAEPNENATSRIKTYQSCTEQIKHEHTDRRDTWPHLSVRFVCPGLRLFQSLSGPTLMIESLDPNPLGNPSPSDSKGGDTGQNHTQGFLCQIRSKFNPNVYSDCQCGFSGDARPKLEDKCLKVWVRLRDDHRDWLISKVPDKDKSFCLCVCVSLFPEISHEPLPRMQLNFQKMITVCTFTADYFWSHSKSRWQPQPAKINKNK